MISEREIENLIHHPTVQAQARHARPGVVATNYATDSAERALAMWIAISTKQYLRSIHAASNPLVEKVWSFARGNADIDMRVGVNGAYRKFKVETSMTGPQTFKLQIRSWHKGLVGFSVHEQQDLWVRYGAYRGSGGYEGIETLPVR